MPYEVIQALKDQYAYHLVYDTSNDEFWSVSRAIEAVVLENDFKLDEELSSSKLVIVRRLSQWDTYTSNVGAIIRCGFGRHELHFYAHSHAMVQKLVRGIRATGVKLVRKWE